MRATGKHAARLTDSTLRAHRNIRGRLEPAGVKNCTCDLHNFTHVTLSHSAGRPADRLARAAQLCEANRRSIPRPPRYRARLDKFNVATRTEYESTIRYFSRFLRQLNSFPRRLSGERETPNVITIFQEESEARGQRENKRIDVGKKN